MEDKALKILSSLQKKLPNATVFWEKEPGSDPWTDLCILTAVSRIDQTKRFSMEFKNGLGDHPDNETIEVFLDDARIVLA